MNELRVRRWALAALLGTACGPDVGDPPASGSETGGNTTTATSTTTTSSTQSSMGTAIGSTESSSGTTSVSTSSASDAGETSSSCEGWMFPYPPLPWSMQDCLTEPCPEGEVCRYDPNEACGAHPVCVNPDTLACRCEIYPGWDGVACACPGYDGPLNDLGQAPLECNTLMSPHPVSYEGDCIF